MSWHIAVTIIQSPSLANIQSASTLRTTIPSPTTNTKHLYPACRMHVYIVLFTVDYTWMCCFFSVSVTILYSSRCQMRVHCYFIHIYILDAFVFVVGCVRCTSAASFKVLHLQPTMKLITLVIDYLLGIYFLFYFVYRRNQEKVIHTITGRRLKFYFFYWFLTFFGLSPLQIHSGSEFLLNSTGSFKRFDSIDRDYKPVDQPPNQSPSWNINIPEIPPQPLRPAPKSPTFKERGQSPVHKSFEQQQQQQYEQRYVLSISVMQCKVINEHDKSKSYMSNHLIDK